MKLRTGLRVVVVCAALMMLQAVVLTFWCESASVFSFRVEDLTPLAKGGQVLRYPIGEFKSTIPGFLDFAVLLLIAVLVLRNSRVQVFGVEISHRLLALGMLGLAAWNVLFAAFLVVLEFKYLHPCPV